MNEESQNSVVLNPTTTPEQQNMFQDKRWFFVAVAVAVILIAGGYFFYTGKFSKEKTEIPTDTTRVQTGVQDDQVFLGGFLDTGREWSPKETDRLAEHQQNPLTKLRQAYCERVGYQYADFGGDCFVYQYFDSFKIYTNDDERFTVYYPTFWQNDPEPLNYGFVATPKVSLQRQGASCAISYGVIDENTLSSFGVASTTKANFGERALGSISNDTGLAKIILPFGRQLTDEERAAGYTDEKLITIPHFPYPNSSGGFILTSGEKQPLIEACVDEFDTILNGRAINYPATSLTPQSNGIISLRDRSSWFQRYAKIPQKITLLFNNFQTKKEESVAANAFQNIQRMTDPFLSGGKLYLMASSMNPTLMSVDILTGQSKTIPIAYDENTPIHSFFVKGNNLYYLDGKFCNEYLAKCSDMKLKNYNLTTSATETLASGIKARDIDGFDSTGSKLILRWSDGDGGCGWGQYWSFTFSSKTVNDLGSYSRCERGTEDSFAPFRNLAVGTNSFGYLVVKDGRIFSPQSNDAYPSGIYIRVNASEYQQE